MHLRFDFVHYFSLLKHSSFASPEGGEGGGGGGRGDDINGWMD